MVVVPTSGSTLTASAMLRLKATHGRPFEIETDLKNI